MSPSGPRGPVRNQQLPPGAVQVGNSFAFPDSSGVVNSSLRGTLDQNIGGEKGMSQGLSGACPQDPANAPDLRYRRD
jgi:hypothetical protein